MDGSNPHSLCARMVRPEVYRLSSVVWPMWGRGGQRGSHGGVYWSARCSGHKTSSAPARFLLPHGETDLWVCVLWDPDGRGWVDGGRHRVVLVGERETHAARLGWTGVAYWRALRLKEHVGLFAVGRIQMILRFSSRKERSQECFVFFF